MTRSHTRFPIASRFLARRPVPGGRRRAARRRAGATPSRTSNSASAKVQAPTSRDVTDARGQLERTSSRISPVQTDLVRRRRGSSKTSSQLLVDPAAGGGGEARGTRTTVTRLNDRAVEAFMGGPGEPRASGGIVVAGRAVGPAGVHGRRRPERRGPRAAPWRTPGTRCSSSDRAARARCRPGRRRSVGAARRAREVIRELRSSRRPGAPDPARTSRPRSGTKKKVSKAYQAALRAASQPGIRRRARTPCRCRPATSTCSSAAPWTGRGASATGSARLGTPAATTCTTASTSCRPMGTPIVAPFDGYAHSDYNSLGGNVVFVTGRTGTVYNAHLSAYSAKSNGPVQAGDVDRATWATPATRRRRRTTTSSSTRT